MLLSLEGECGDAATGCAWCFCSSQIGSVAVGDGLWKSVREISMMETYLFSNIV